MARMSQDDLPSKPLPTPGASADPAALRTAKPVSPNRPSSRRGGGVTAAVIIALLALSASGYVGWRQWQQMQGDAANHLAQRVGTLETTVGDIGGERATLRRQLDDASQVNRALREEVLGQSERLRNLEDAVARLAEKSQSGHDAMLLDETESLLRMANERYALFHDAHGAAVAYAQADQALAMVNDSAFSSLRQSLGAEREALEKSAQADPATALVSLGQLRDAIAGLPLKPLDQPEDHATVGAWARIRQALLGVISVQRDNGAPLAVADARFARELAALDLAQAQAAAQAYDNEAAVAALRRADASLAAQFDPHAPAVQQARTQLAALISQLKPTAPVQLGAALAELHNLRAVHALKPVDSAIPAATGGTAGGARP
jgi:uroporphyrin-III C-methyltransferase